MSDCDALATCPFFNDKLANMPATASRLKQQYCYAEWSVCARWRVRQALGRNRVPPDLFPHNRERAAQLIALG